MATSVPAAIPPALSLEFAPGGIRVSWPATPGHWALEETSLASPVVWKLVPATLQQRAGEVVSVDVGPLVNSRFYRLTQLVERDSALTGYWALDQASGGVAPDSTGLGHTLYLSDVSWAEGYRGSALQFSNQTGMPVSQAWVSNTNHRLLPPGSFTLSFRFNPDALAPGWYGLAGTAAQGTDGWQLALNTSGPGTNHLVFSAPGMQVAGRGLILPGQWYQATLAYDGEVASLYLNGSLLAQGAGSIPAHDGPLYLGGGIGGHPGFFGRMDEVRSHATALTPEEIALAGHWRFDEGAGLLAADITPNSRAATLTADSAWVTGRTGTGIDTSRSAVTIRNDDQSVLPSTGAPFSLSLWLNPRSLADPRSGLISCTDQTQSGWSLELENDSGQLRARWSSLEFGGTLDLRVPVDLSVDHWSRLDLNYDGGLATIYVDGKAAGSASGGIRVGAAALLLGRAPGASNFQGTIDEAKVFQRARSPDEIGPQARVMWETVWVNTETNFVLQGAGPPGKALVYTIVNAVVPTNGTVSHVPGTGIVTYQAGNRKGPDAFAYTVSDGEFTTPPTIVALSVVRPLWLAPEGGPVEPRDGTSPERALVAGPAPALDAILRTNNYYDCFYYAPGVYHTTGRRFNARTTANPGCKHIGSGAEGPNATTLRLVEAAESTAEGLIFGLRLFHLLCDGFEVHHMTLDCNAHNNPMYQHGELTTLVVPLASTSFVESVTLRWADGSIPAVGPIPGRGTSTWRLGRSTEFRLCTRTLEGVTNCISVTSTGRVDVVPLGVVTDQIVVLLDRRPASVDFISLQEIEVTGAQVSLPAAVAVAGDESQLASPDARYSILSAVDGNMGTAWASGSEAQVEIALPFPTNTTLDGIQLNWNCRMVDLVGTLGPAASFAVRARDQTSGEWYDVPFVAQPRGLAGDQLIRFGAAESAMSIVTDRVMLVLTARESGVDYYSLKEIAPRNGAVQAALRLPTASSALAWSGVNGSFLAAFDKHNGTRWACRTQGMVGAMEVRGSNMKFTNLRIVGFGTKAVREAFPVGIHTPLAGHAVTTHLGNVLVEDCVVTEPATSNSDGLTAFSITSNLPHTLTNAIVRRCAVRGVRQHFVYSHAYHVLHVENSTAEEVDHGVYFEPDGGATDLIAKVIIRSNQFVNVRRGVYLLMHPGARFDSITCVDNDIVLSQAGGWGIVACDTCVPGPSGTITNLTVLNNVVRYADWLPRPQNLEGGLFYSNIRHGVFGNNLVALGTLNGLRLRDCPSGSIPPVLPPEECPPEGGGLPLALVVKATHPPCLDPPLPGYRRAWFNNRDLNGALLPARFRQAGSDGLASDPQWP